MVGIAPRRLALLSFALLGLVGCQTQVIPRRPDVSPRPVEERGRWQVHGAAGELGGTLRRFVIVDPRGEVVFYRVEDMAGRWVGDVRSDGWFSRRVPFQDDPQPLGLYPMEDGLAVLLGLEGPVRLVAGPWDGEELPAGPKPATVRRLDGQRAPAIIPWR